MSWDSNVEEEFLRYDEKHPDKWDALLQEALRRAEAGESFAFKELLVYIREQGTPISNHYRMSYRDKFVMAHPEHAHLVRTRVPKKRRIASILSGG